ncbi:hypothetical protein BI364_03225 [Acidihalobacter yilgarnensis]|uniref:DEAD-box ATP-dependent RNA helicase RhpA n=1 Tax=Acidihalobacter yilgarnensis TaxID=2819280 RepID=A0A1D8IT46_9GAMM|nr:DEAD/DEAH box helicase [Acidihalobacter yilgarnensis]AOU99504.1 hypothetical protein BI364_03225 [Acidihalobacter yilgarnensis]
MSFSDLGLSAAVLRAVTEQGYETPTPIQAQAIPAVLRGKDLMAGAQTGTGKTAAFTLPLLDRLIEGAQGGPRRVRALILTPTRELAAQVQDSVRVYGSQLPLRSAAVFGGVGIQPQISALRRGVDILVATPGRLQDHLDRGTVDLSKVEIMVLDEADRMLDMGFLPAIERILRSVPERRQTLLFSATFAGPIRQLAGRFLREPEMIEVARANATTEAVTQAVYLVDHARKRELLSYLIGSRNWRQVLVFTRTKRGADRLAMSLAKDGLSAAAIHGDKSQGARTRALKDFKQQSVRVLVATDVAARGLDIDRLPYVVNYELPDTPEDYVHRIGRTGRAGERGEALSLVCADESEQFRAIQRLISIPLPVSTVDGFEPESSFDPNRAPGKPAAKRGAGNNKVVARRRPSQDSQHPRGERSRPQTTGKPGSPRARQRRA